jgi:hypothetical protein
MACFNCLRLLEISWKFRLQAKNSFEFLKKYYQTTLLSSSSVAQHPLLYVIENVTTQVAQQKEYCENEKNEIYDDNAFENEIIRIEPVLKTVYHTSEYVVMNINKREEDIIQELESADLDDEDYEYNEKVIENVHSSVELINDGPAEENLNYIDVQEQSYVSEQQEERTDEIIEASTSNVNIYQQAGFTESVQEAQNDAVEEIFMDKREEPDKSRSESVCSDFSKATNRYRCEECYRSFSQVTF